MSADWTIRRYTPDYATAWDRFVDDSRQGTFLHKRRYLEYHSDRIEDFSLIAMRGDKIAALLPANRVGRTLCSHGGLTYGGWLTPCNHFDGTDMVELFGLWLGMLRTLGFDKVVYKPVPHIYHKQPAEEDIYALYRFGAHLDSVQLSSAVFLPDNPGFNAQQTRNLKRAVSCNYRVWETENAAEVINMVNDCLRERHNTLAVHSAEELQLLRDRFPQQIRLFLCGREGEAEAGVCVYDTGVVAHSQYIASTAAGRANGALAYLFNRLINSEFAGRRYFDFGTSNEQGGQILNAGLHHQKAGLGGRGIAYPTYLIEL